MITPVIFVLFLALECSTVTIHPEPADADEHAATKIINADAPARMEGRTNLKIEQKKYQDEIYNPENDIAVKHSNSHSNSLKRSKNKYMRHFNMKNEVKDKRRNKRYADDENCEAFLYDENDSSRIIKHPHASNSTTYYNNSNCVTIVSTTEGKIIILTFIDVFHIESHPDCAYDYLEIRDGKHGYSDILAKVCGEAFPEQIKTTGPNAWLKFRSDDTIEYEGFTISIDFVAAPSHSTPGACYKTLRGKYGVIDFNDTKGPCLDGTTNQYIDFLWTIETPPKTKIYLNFTTYTLARPNECEYNVIQVFGTVVEMDKKLAAYCGSMAYSVTTKDENGDPGNVMKIRLHLSKDGYNATHFNATYVAFKTLDPNKDDKCDDDQFDCTDNTCISQDLKCDDVAHCRLKTDEDKDTTCILTAQSVLNTPHIMVILIIFSLILAGMSFVFLFKCIRKLYLEHKIIKEHLRQSCEDRLDTLVSSRLTLDAKRLHQDSLPRASLERENHTNEMYKQQRSHSKHKQSSIDSDYIQETQLDIEEEPWRREVDSVPVEMENVRLERNGRTRSSDLSRKEEYIRSKRKESEDVKEKREIRDVSVGAPDTKESGCQTRESLFQSEAPPSSDGSGTNSRGFSTFGYSGGTVVRPSPPTKTSEITIELTKQTPRQESIKPQKKLPDRRPISAETTRSAPDVIIVSKPVR